MDRSGYIFDILHAVYLRKDTLLFIIGHNFGRLCVISAEAKPHRFFVVIGSTGKLRATAIITDAILYRLLEPVVVPGTTIRTAVSASNTLDQCFFVNFQLDHLAER